MGHSLSEIPDWEPGFKDKDTFKDEEYFVLLDLKEELQAELERIKKKPVRNRGLQYVIDLIDKKLDKKAAK